MFHLPPFIDMSQYVSSDAMTYQLGEQVKSYSDCVRLYSHLFWRGFMFHYLFAFIYLCCSASGTAYPSGAPDPPPEYILFYHKCYVECFMCMLCRSLFVLFFYFLFDIVLSVLLRYTDYDYPFDIFKLFL